MGGLCSGVVATQPGELALNQLDSAAAAFRLRLPSTPQLAQIALASALAAGDDFAADAAAEILRKSSRVNLTGGHLGPTPQLAATASRDQPCRPDRPGRVSDSVSRLERAGTISPAQADAAREIASTFEAVTAASAARICRYERSSRSGSGDLPQRVALIYSMVFKPWLCKLTEKQRSIVLAVVVDGLSLDTTRRNVRCSFKTAQSLLSSALDAFIQQKRG